MNKLDIAKFLTNQMVSQFRSKILITAVYGSVAMGTADKFSDIDMFAIIDDDLDLVFNGEFVLLLLTSGR